MIVDFTEFREVKGDLDQYLSTFYARTNHLVGVGRSACQNAASNSVGLGRT